MASGFEKKKILLIDNNKIQLEIAESFLKDEYEIYKVPSEYDAIKFIIQTKCNLDLIMLDTVKPRMVRTEFFHLVKGISLLQDIPIVFLTPAEGIQIEEGELIVPCISKPYNEIELGNTVKTLLNQYKSIPFTPKTT